MPHPKMKSDMSGGELIFVLVMAAIFFGSMSLILNDLTKDYCRDLKRQYVASVTGGYCPPNLPSRSKQ